MFLFLSEIDSPTNSEDFTNDLMDLLERLRDKEIMAEGWMAYGDYKNIIQGWILDDAQLDEEGAIQIIQQTVADSIGWTVSTRIFSVVDRAPFPGGPGSTRIVCHMPYNRHPIINQSNTKSCRNNHVFSNDHNITHCPVHRCGLLLK
jgi:hypothetical protein